MPRDGATTRELLIDAGQTLFARDGLVATPLSKVIAAAGQRNTSALHYHFGGRDGLLDAIIGRHDLGIEAERAEILAGLERAGRMGDIRALVEAIVTPQAHKLDSVEGREFLMIVSQLVDLFGRWDEGRTPRQAHRAFKAIEAALPEGLSAAMANERVARFLELVSEALGARARQLTRRRPPAISNDEFIANLVDMAVGALSAPPTRSAPAG